ncbi:MAG: STAS domain-containing protein [Chloroflexi bacterium]|nr:STAS domain-containing protein [Chloroflexota bacterium]
MQRVIERFHDVVPGAAKEATDRVAGLGLSSYQGLSRQQLEGAIRAGFNAFGEDLIQGSDIHFKKHWEKIAVVRVEHGARLEEVSRGIVTGSQILDQHMRAALDGDLEATNWWLSRQNEIVTEGLLTLGGVFIAARERMISEQNMQLRELSTPLMPIHQGVLVLPLVGQIDPRRASQVMETLLEGISAQSADVVIMDITGVPVVDTQVANYLIQAARAARLLGAKIVLVGIGPEIAQTIIQLGVDLSDITTRANLESGINYALGLQGLAITAAPALEQER